MRRFLCFSLCLGLMVSACKKKSAQESLNKAIAKAGGGGDGDGGDGTTTVTKKDKAAVLKACLPKINARLIQTYQEAQQYFVFRSSTLALTSEEAPSLLVYTGAGTPLVFGDNDQFGLGNSQAAVTTNLNEMAADEDVQGQFVARDNNAKGWRVFISGSGTLGPEVEQPALGEAFAAPAADEGFKIYDRDSLAIEGVRHEAIARVEGDDEAAVLRRVRDNDPSAGWYDCAVDDDDAVTLVYTQTQMT